MDHKLKKLTFQGIEPYQRQFLTKIKFSKPIKNQLFPQDNY